MTDAPGRDSASDEADEAPFKALSPEEAEALRARLPTLTPWHVVWAQAAVGVLCALLTWGITQRSAAAWSAAYGALTVVLPGALMAHGMSRRAGSPTAAVTSFLFWELMKMALAIAMLVAVAKWAPSLSWPALLVAMVVCMKLGWLALLRRRR